MKKKKSVADVGTVLQKVKEKAKYKPWAEYVLSQETLKERFSSANELENFWSSDQNKFHAFTVTDPKGAKTPGFDSEYGLVVFSVEPTRALLSNVDASVVSDSDLSQSGIIHFLHAKEGHKTAAKYILTATERFISDHRTHVLVVVGEKDGSTQRFLRQLEYSEATSQNGVIIFRKILPKHDA